MAKCIYCGEEEATEIIMSPNCDDEKNPVWDVCKDCKDTIKEQQKLSFGAMIAHMKDDFSKNYGEKIMNEANKKLDEIAKRTKKPIMNACISKSKDGSYKSAEIIFTGED